MKIPRISENLSIPKKLFSLLALLSIIPQSSSGEDVWRAGTLQNAELDELSGLAASQTRAGVYWGINDSGNEPYLYALGQNGRDFGRVAVNNLTNRDPEALGYGNCAFAPKCIYVADIGDNRKRRREVRIEVIPEPSAGDTQAAVAKTIFVTYAGGAINAEAMLLRPRDGAILIIEKRDLDEQDRPARIFWVGPQMSNSRQNRILVREVATIATRSSGNIQTGPFTDAVYSAGGSDFYLRDYNQVYHAVGLVGRGEAVALSPIPSPRMMIGEAIAINQDTTGLVISSEGRHAPIATISLNTNTRGQRKN